MKSLVWVALLSGGAAWAQVATPAAPAASAAQEPSPGLQECAAIGAPSDRLACYDKLAGRKPPSPPPADVPIATTQMAPQGAATAPAQEAKPEASPLSQYWELDATDKRGTFNLLGYRANYVMPLHKTNRINRAPQSPTQTAVNQPNYRDVEAKFQISLRTKAIQDVFGRGSGDLWLAFTQQAMWQIWNGKDSKPFRNTDYEPEAIYVFPVPKVAQHLPFGWQWRLGQVGIAHQSNGQSDPLSRSWNRVYIGTGFERGDLSLQGRFSHRLSEKRERDNNPDLVDYRGRTELQLGWTPGASTSSLLWRNSAQRSDWGALQFEWTYPVAKSRPNGLRWFVQAFHGYGETLTDYNFKQTSFGFGLGFMQF
ncbi:phospholipase A [Piscinibacter sp. HJYY11]|uniref:phospholipase A n=1 Tax=Piscinibacter sp. HJYY11 TaxID=2801333 RepID=UPI002873BA19|nr:phospholipase A [Piscinibacter sp. HJYY11]